MLLSFHETEPWIVNWCLEPRQPLLIISGLKETFLKRYRLQRTNKAEVRPQEQSEKTELSGEFMEWLSPSLALEAIVSSDWSPAFKLDPLVLWDLSPKLTTWCACFIRLHLKIGTRFKFNELSSYLIPNGCDVLISKFLLNLLLDCFPRLNPEHSVIP